ncbi:hypothetical protein AwEntero_09280 [Enterobacterales bacterium]|nr:hypothetical protein AwEntero_09280 [Enterobacterales bacterium]
MINALSLAFSQMIERPRWQQWALCMVGALSLLSVLYFMMLKSPLQQLQQGLQDAETLRKNLSGQQHRLLIQPSLNELLQQQAHLKPLSFAGATLVEKIAEPLRQSAGTLLHWQPEAASVENEERGTLTFQSDFRGLLGLLKALLDDPVAPVVRQLQLRGEKSLLHITLSLVEEPFYSPTFVAFSTVFGGDRDPFSAKDIEVCSDNADTFRDVILGGIISDTEHQQGWMLWPGRGWQPAEVGWRDVQSGWQIVAVGNEQVGFNLRRAPCAEKQHWLMLSRQSGLQSMLFEGEGER